MLKIELSIGERHLVNSRPLRRSSATDPNSLCNQMAIWGKSKRRLTTKADPMLFT